VLWCKGSTKDFGSLREGSNPSSTTMSYLKTQAVLLKQSNYDILLFLYNNINGIIIEFSIDEIMRRTNYARYTVRNSLDLLYRVGLVQRFVSLNKQQHYYKISQRGLYILTNPLVFRNK